MCFFKRRDCVYFRASRRRKGRDYIRGNELSFQEVIMDLGLRARQTTRGEQRGGNTGAEVQNVCTQWICTHSYTHTQTHTWFGWTSVQFRELVGCWDGRCVSHHKIPPIFKAPVLLEVMVSIPCCQIGSVLSSPL